MNSSVKTVTLRKIPMRRGRVAQGVPLPRCGPAQRSDGIRPVCFAIRASIFGPISSPPSRMANSFVNREDAVDLRNLFSVLEPDGQHLECKCFRLRDRFVTVRAVCQDSRKLWHLADPAAIVFALDVDGEIAHVMILVKTPAQASAPSPRPRA